MLDAIILGVVQGITEWLPVSSQGAVTAAGSFFLDLTLKDALAFALWLHLGTALAAVIAFRADVLALAREALRDPLHPSPFLRFLAVGTLSSVVVGLPLVMSLDDVPVGIGAGAMIGVGGLMLITAAVLRRRPAAGTRERGGLTLADAVLTGVAQGFAALPGLSRSGLTVAVLLGRGLDRTEALAVSFIMSIPAGIGAAVFASAYSERLRTSEGVAGAIVAAVVGLVSIRALLAVAHRINFARFMLLAALAIIAGGVANLWL